jgi:membrane protein DedA with SNARE-associated domain
MNLIGIELLLVFLTALVPFAPTEAVFIGAGAFVASGQLSLPVVIAVGAFGCVLSDLINYRAGQVFGTRLLRRFSRQPRGAIMVAWIGRQLGHRPVSILVAGRFLPAGGLIGAVACGASEFGLRRFVPVSVLGSSLWTGYAVSLGMIGGYVVRQPLLGMVFGLVLALMLGAVSGAVTRLLPDRHLESAPDSALVLRA